MSEWQPIETAPKDGTAILGFVGQDWEGRPILVPVQWDLEENRWQLAWGVWGDESYTANPTYWQPLPPPPQ